jgi:hypothetical protein
MCRRSLLCNVAAVAGSVTGIRIYAKRTATAAPAKFIPSSTLPHFSPTTVKNSSLCYRILFFVVLLMNCRNILPQKSNSKPEKAMQGGAYSGEAPTGPAVRI